MFICYVMIICILRLPISSIVYHSVYLLYVDFIEKTTSTTPMMTMTTRKRRVSWSSSSCSFPLAADREEGSHCC